MSQPSLVWRINRSLSRKHIAQEHQIFCAVPLVFWVGKIVRILTIVSKIDSLARRSKIGISSIETLLRRIYLLGMNPAAPTPMKHQLDQLHGCFRVLAGQSVNFHILLKLIHKVSLHSFVFNVGDWTNFHLFVHESIHEELLNETEFKGLFFKNGRSYLSKLICSLISKSFGLIHQTRPGIKSFFFALFWHFKRQISNIC